MSGKTKSGEKLFVDPGVDRGVSLDGFEIAQMPPRPLLDIFSRYVVLFGFCWFYAFFQSVDWEAGLDSQP